MLGFNCFSQKNKLVAFEDSLTLQRKATLKTKNDEQRLKANNNFIKTLERALQQEKSFEHSFDSVPYTAFLMSKDKKFRIINWNVPFDNGSHRYFCFIQLYSKKSKCYETYQINDYSEQLTNPEYKSLNSKTWFGALYYEIIPQKTGKKSWYTLLGWDGNDNLSNKKVIDVLSFAANGQPKFGTAIFKTKKDTKRRVIFEYSEDAMMSVRYHPKKNQIVFDHLSPRQPQLEGEYQFYGPDFTYDAFEWQKNKWVLLENIEITNEYDAIYNPELKSEEKKIYEPKNR